VFLRRSQNVLPHHSNYLLAPLLVRCRISRFVFNAGESQSLMKYLIMPRACRRSHISRAPFAPLGSGAHSAPAWVGWLLANAVRVQLCLCFAAGCGRPQNTASSHQVFIARKRTVFNERVRPPSRL